MFWGMRAFQQVPCSIKIISVSELLEKVKILLRQGNRISVSGPRKLTTLQLATRISLEAGVPHFKWDTKKVRCAEGPIGRDRGVYSCVSLSSAP